MQRIEAAHDKGKGMFGGTKVDQIEDDIDRQATAWLVKLADDPQNEALRGHLMGWLAASPVHRAAWQETARVSDLIALAGPVPPIAPELPARPAHLGWLRKASFARALASVGMAFCLAWLVGPKLAVEFQADESTGTAELRLVVLDDGSQAYLAPDSAIAFASDTKGRSVDLLRGEAYFDVAHDAKRPFKVLTDDSRVTVLGTAFSVSRRDRGVDVAVERGRVAVAIPGRNGARETILTAGQSLIFGAARARAIRPDRVASWREGVAIIDDQSVGAVIDRIRPWYRGRIVATGPGLFSRRVSGIYNLRNPDLALEALARAHDISVTRVSPWLRIVTVN